MQLGDMEIFIWLIFIFIGGYLKEGVSIVFKFNIFSTRLI